MQTTGLMVPPPQRSSSGPLRTLLVEDDDGDAFLVEELLAESAAPVELIRARSLGEARGLLDGVQCVLLDLGLPDTEQLSGLHDLRESAPSVAVLVLTGLADEHRGVEALAAGAQDYLVKGQIDGSLLHRSIRYAVERRRADEDLRALTESELRAKENARLERGLLPTPLTRDPSLSCVTRYRPGRRRALLGGDFFDVLEREDGTLLLLIGDVAGHGPDEAALGVSLRIGWRALVLAGIDVDRILPTLDEVLVRERDSEEVFATVCMLVVPPERERARLYLAGHPAPLMLPPCRRSADLCARPMPDDVIGPALGVVPGVVWGSQEVPLGPEWSLVLFTDGLVEGRVDGGGPDRLGAEGLARILDELAQGQWESRRLADDLIDRVERLHGGELTDDVALVLVTRQAQPAP